MSPTERLYLDDSTRLVFHARVVRRFPQAQGGVEVVLDRTCFYPTSGGQPHDTGWIAGVPVLDVREEDDDTLRHVLPRDPGDGELPCQVDADRRRDHMQQHSGQHLLSATCVSLLQRETLSFHLGAERCSIELPGPLLDEEELRRVEAQANAVIWEGRSVRVQVLPAQEALTLRKPPPAGLGTIRIVEIEGWDQSACCGTHVRRTSEIGLVKLLGQERLRDGLRLFFVCGSRALQELQRTFEREQDLVQRLTCHPDELASRLEKLQEEARILRKQVQEGRKLWALAQARAWIATAPTWRHHPLVCRILETEETDGLSACAAALTQQGAVALLGAPGERAQLLFSCPEDMGLDLRPVLQVACSLLGGRGGGTPSRVQGSGPRSEDLEMALQAAEKALRETIVFDKEHGDA